MSASIKVGQEHRTHPWSFQIGGVTLYVAKPGSPILIYDKVKDVMAYSRGVKRNCESARIFYKNREDKFEEVKV